MESDTLRRSQTLSRTALGTVLVITLVQFTLPIVIGKAAVIGKALVSSFVSLLV